MQPREQGDTVISCHASHHANAGKLVREQFSVVLLQLVDLFFVVRRNAIHRLRGEKGRTECTKGTNVGKTRVNLVLLYIKRSHTSSC